MTKQTSPICCKTKWIWYQHNMNILLPISKRGTTNMDDQPTKSSLHLIDFGIQKLQFLPPLETQTKGIRKQTVLFKWKRLQHTKINYDRNHVLKYRMQSKWRTIITSRTVMNRNKGIAWNLKVKTNHMLGKNVFIFQLGNFFFKT